MDPLEPRDVEKLIKALELPEVRAAVAQAIEVYNSPEEGVLQGPLIIRPAKKESA